jgi:hypothetical protein
MTTNGNSGLFQPISVTQGSVKIGAFGPQGSGKTTTLFLLGIGLSLTYHNAAPIMYHDTENGSDFMKAIADIEGVPVLVRKSRSFTDMCQGIHEGERQGACVYLEDSITHDWNELMEAFKAKKQITRIEINHWGEIKPQWANDWVVPMLNSPMHVLIAGRAGMIYENVEQEDGTTKNEVTGSKMKAEGDFGYEPNLLIEMFGERVRMAPDGTPVKGKKRAAKHGGTYVHHAYVLKDRTRNLQGKEFTWQNLNDYKKGDWKKVFAAFEPHFKFFSIGSAQKALTSSPSTDLFDKDGNSEYYQKKRRREVALEEIETTMTLLWPGKDAKSTRIKLLVIEKIFHTRSWTAVTNLQPDKIEDGLSILRDFEFRSRNAPRDDEAVVMQVFAEMFGAVPAEQAATAAPTVTQ